MDYILKDSEYNFIAREKKILLNKRYAKISISQIRRIINISTSAVIYDDSNYSSSIKFFNGTIIYYHDNEDQSDTDKLQIVLSIEDFIFTEILKEVRKGNILLEKLIEISEKNITTKTRRKKTDTTPQRNIED